MTQRHTRDTPTTNPHGTELMTLPQRARDPTATSPRRARDEPAHTTRTWVQPPEPQTVNGNPSLRIREKAKLSRLIEVLAFKAPHFPRQGAEEILKLVRPINVT